MTEIFMTGTTDLFHGPETIGAHEFNVIDIPWFLNIFGHI